MANYFALPGEPRYETPSFKRSNAWEATRQEVFAVREGVGINEIQNFGKFRVKGPMAREWLDRIMAGLIPKPGRLSLTPMLSRKGRIIGDLTVTCISETEFQLTGSYGAQDQHRRWFEMNLEPGVTVENMSDRLTGFQIAGPKVARPARPGDAGGCVGGGVPVHGCAGDHRWHGALSCSARQLYRRSGV